MQILSVVQPSQDFYGRPSRSFKVTDRPTTNGKAARDFRLVNSTIVTSYLARFPSIILQIIDQIVAVDKGYGSTLVPGEPLHS